MPSILNHGNPVAARTAAESAASSTATGIALAGAAGRYEKRSTRRKLGSGRSKAVTVRKSPDGSRVRPSSFSAAPSGSRSGS
jgi:hypothetical protein